MIEQTFANFWSSAFGTFYVLLKNLIEMIASYSSKFLKLIVNNKKFHKLIFANVCDGAFA